MMQKVREKLKRRGELLKHDEEMMLSMEETLKRSKTERDNSTRSSKLKIEQEKEEREETSGHKRKVELLKWDGPPLPTKEQRREALPGYRIISMGDDAREDSTEDIIMGEESTTESEREQGSTVTTEPYFVDIEG